MGMMSPYRRLLRLFQMMQDLKMIQSIRRSPVIQTMGPLIWTALLNLKVTKKTLI